jgi:hypothetical protein
MVRSLSSALINALNSVTRRPALTLTVEDHTPHYATYQTPGTADSWNDVCVASDNSIIRVQLTPGGSGLTSNFQVQRITDPTQAAQWASWSTLSGGAGNMFLEGECAVANSGGTLYAFAQRGMGGNNLWSWVSTTNGQTWSGPTTVLSPAGGALLNGIGSAGNNDVFFLYDISGGVALGCSFLVAGSWSALRTWTLPALSAGEGVAVVWSASLYTIVYSDGYSLATCTFDPVTNLWATGVPVAPSTGTAIGRLSPRVSFADGLYTLTCIEADSGLLTGAVYSYPRLRQSADLVHWSDGTIVPDLPCSYNAVAFKLVAPQSGSAGPRYYLATMLTVYSAPAFQNANPTQVLDISAAVLSYRRIEQVGSPARLEVVLDNAQGGYNALVASGAANEPLGLQASLVLSEGYYSSGVPATTRVGTYRLSALQFQRSSQENQIVLVGLDLTQRLDRVARYQNSYAGQTVGYLVTEICARAGLFAIALPAVPQISQVIPVFTLLAGQTYRQVLDELCGTYSLVYFLDQDEVLRFRELSAGDSSVWSYQPEIEAVRFENKNQQANHIIVSGKPPTGGLLGALTTAEAYDAVHLRVLGVEQLLHHVDVKLTTATQCAQKATFLLAQQQRMHILHTMTVPLNPALQPFDVLTLTDSVAPQGSGQQSTCRIVSIEGRYDAASARAELLLSLEGL